MHVIVQFDYKVGYYRLYGAAPDEYADANAFLEVVTIRGLSLETVRTYAFDLAIFYRWLELSGKRLEELQQAMLLDFISYQKKSGAQPTSINHRLTTCRLLYRFVTGKEMEAGSRVSTPAPHYKGRGREHNLGLHPMSRQRCLKLRVKVPHKIVEPLDSTQVLTFLESLRRYRDLAIVYLMLFCGLRSKEVLGLRLIDFSLGERRLHIIGKGNRERVLPLPEVLVRVISDYMRLERPSDSVDKHIFVVLQGNRRGKAMTASGLRSLFRHRRESRKSICNANAHRFRHTYGADMARAGVSLPILQRMMGHASSITTLQYINLSMADIAEQYIKVMKTIEKRYEH